MSEFTIGETSFRVEPLKPIQACEGLSLLVEGLLPSVVSAFRALAQEGGDDRVFFESLAKSAAKLPRVYELFIGVSSVQWEGRWVPLKAFEANVFARKMPLLLAWLSRCLREEYADFLSATGRDLLAGAASDWTSLAGSVGRSGG